MSEHDSAAQAELLQRFEKQFSLCVRSPDDVPRPIAVAVSGAIEYDDAVVFGGQFDQAAGFEILNHAAVTVEKHQRPAGAALQIVDPHAFDLDEAPGRRIVALRLFGKLPINDRRSSQRAGYDACGNIGLGLDRR